MIINNPENKTVYLLDQSAVFTCETDGHLSGWEINETVVGDLPVAVGSELEFFSTITENGTTLLKLTIPARAEYNNTRVQCVVVKLGDPPVEVESETAILKVQGITYVSIYSMNRCYSDILGLLSAVGDLRASSNASSVTISWTAPFSLDVTGVDPDIWYSVLIYNVTDENNPTAILCTDCINITETHYTFTPDYLSPCHVYNFSVIPVNGAGQGESSPHVSGYVLNCKYISIFFGMFVTSFGFLSYQLFQSSTLKLSLRMYTEPLSIFWLVDSIVLDVQD